MKKFLTAVFVGSLVFVGHTVGANEPLTPDQATEVEAATANMPGSVIDKIEVPFKVLQYVETKYPGHAVTQASKFEKNGEKAYRLRVDRDTDPSDYNSIYLFYDKDWELLDDQKMIAPPKPIEEDEPKPEPEDKKNNEERDNRGEGNEEEEKPEEAPPEPVDETEPDNSGTGSDGSD